MGFGVDRGVMWIKRGLGFRVSGFGFGEDSA